MCSNKILLENIVQKQKWLRNLTRDDDYLFIIIIIIINC
jgi:hypothetical protein